ncbi:hypothetical protein I4U23_010384 [Adineta vaga]|nr:hypothetical protein I4U23_010384 [Adineta vaga]
MLNSFQKEPWHGSFFGVCASPKTCCAVTFCTSCMFGYNAADVTNNSCWGYCCGYFLLMPCYLCGVVHMPIRAKIREKYNLQEEPNDCIAACLLSPCGICQESNELKSHEKSSGIKVQTMQPLNSTISHAESEMTGASDVSQTS